MVIPKSTTRKSRGSKRFFWDFTLNNYTNEDCESVIPILENICDAYVVGKEVGKKCGTPHLQGCVKLKKGQYKTYLTNILGERYSIREGRNIEKMREYCQKDNIWIKKNVERIKIYTSEEERNSDYVRNHIYMPMFNTWKSNMLEIYPDLEEYMTYDEWYNRILRRNDE